MMKNVAVVGFGNVGSGVIELLWQGRVAGLALKKVVVKYLEKPRPLELPSAMLTAGLNEVISDPDIQVIVELVGDAEVAAKIIFDALENGKEVVTANKSVIAEKGDLIFTKAARLGRFVGFRGTFVGCHSLIHELNEARLSASRMKRILAILNGTSNYILSTMSKEAKSFDEALFEAQERGYAEQDPSQDIDGIDTAYKLRILLGLINDTCRPPGSFPIEGIRGITLQDIQYADELGYRVKLIGAIEQPDKLAFVRVHPVLIPPDSLLGSVEGNNNAIEIEDELGVTSGWVAPGAGKYPASLAIIKDLVDIAQERKPLFPRQNNIIPLGDIGELQTRYYLRFSVADQAGVLAQICNIFWQYNVSISTVTQKKGESRNFVPVVMTTHPVKAKDLWQSVSQINQLEIIKAPTKIIGIYEKK
jgi:homoserine dehydrogenase